MNNFDLEQMKREKESNYLRLFIIGLLVFVILIGNINIRDEVAPEGKELVTSLTTPRKGNIMTTFKSDLMNYIPNVNKLNIISTHKETKKIVEEIATTSIKLEELKQEEDQLRTLIANVPIEIYNHNKLDLTAFIVDELKARNLVYSIKYNYDLNAVDEEDEENQESEEGETDNSEEQEDTKVNSPKVTPITEAFSVRIYQVDKDDNYSKTLDILDTMYIKEPYEIVKFKMGYDNVSKSYYVEYVIGV